MSPEGARHGRFTLTPESGLVKVGNHVGRPLSPLPLLSRDEEDLLHSRRRLIYVEVGSDSKQSSEYQHTGASRLTLIDSQSEVEESHPISRPSLIHRPSRHLSLADTRNLLSLQSTTPCLVLHL